MTDSRPTPVRVQFEPLSRTARGEAGETISQVAARVGLDLISACGGLAICAGCRVRVEGESPSEQSAARLNQGLLAAGHRLACATPVVADLTVHVPTSLARPARLATPLPNASGPPVMPLVTVHDLVLGDEPSTALEERVIAAFVDTSPSGRAVAAERVIAEGGELRSRGVTSVRFFAVHGPRSSIAETMVPAEDVPDGPALGLVAHGRENGSVVQIVNLATAREVLEVRHPARCREGASLLDLAAQAHEAIRLHGFEAEQLRAAIVLCPEVGPGVDRHDATDEIEGVGRWHRAADLGFPIHPAAPVVHVSGGALGPSVAALAALPAFLGGARVHLQVAGSELWVVLHRKDEWIATCVQSPSTVDASSAAELLGEWLAADEIDPRDPDTLFTVGGDTRTAEPSDRTLMRAWLSGIATDRVHWIGDARLDGLRALLTSHEARVSWSRRDPILRVDRLRTHRDPG